MQKYFVEERGKLAASGKNWIALATPVVAMSSSAFGKQNFVNVRWKPLEFPVNFLSQCSVLTTKLKGRFTKSHSVMIRTAVEVTIKFIRSCCISPAKKHPIWFFFFTSIYIIRYILTNAKAKSQLLPLFINLSCQLV